MQPNFATQRATCVDNDSDPMSPGNNAARLPHHFARRLRIVMLVQVRGQYIGAFAREPFSMICLNKALMFHGHLNGGTLGHPIAKCDKPSGWLKVVLLRPKEHYE